MHAGIVEHHQAQDRRAVTAPLDFSGSQVDLNVGFQISI